MMALSQSAYKLKTGDHRQIQKDRQRIKEMRTLSAADSSTKVVKGFMDVMAKESFKMVLEGYQNKSEDIYTGYSASMREATEEKMRKGLLWDGNTGQKKMVRF